MRNCVRCQAKMLEDYDVKVDSAGYGIVIASGAGIFAKRIEKPKVLFALNVANYPFILKILMNC